MTTLEALLHDPDSAGEWSLDHDRSTVGFKIRNLWGLINVKGRFPDVDGDGTVTSVGAVFGHLEIHVASLRTGIGKRDEHLRSADFFDVDRFPQISIEVTAVEPGPANTADLQATFAIKGVTAVVPLPVQITALDDGSVRVSAKTEVDRDQFDIGWNRLGMVGKTVTVSAEAHFVRTAR